MASAPQKLCLVDLAQELVRAFKTLGCIVHYVDTNNRPFLDISEELEKAEFTPDLLIHQEKLGRKVVLNGLHRINCPRIYWSIDTHMNAWWQRHYALLFDEVCTTQKRCFDDISPAGSPHWMPWFGQDFEWLPWKTRKHHISFAGRITEHRTSRRWMTELIQKRYAAFTPHIVQDIPFPEMLQMYRLSRIAPNESIAAEINFRLFEAASCGCLVVGQNIPYQDELFEPGKEIEVFDHAVEMVDIIDRALKDPARTQSMAHAAWERIHTEHLPKHRAKTFLEIAKEAPRVPTDEHELHRFMALFLLWETGALSIDPEWLRAQLATLPKMPETIGAGLRADVMLGDKTQARQTLLSVLTSDQYKEDTALNLTCSMSALHVAEAETGEWWDIAKAFWYRQQQRTGKGAEPAQNATHLRKLWARELGRSGMIYRGGLPFDPAHNIPGSALECLIRVIQDDPQDLEALRQLEQLTRNRLELEQSRVGFLSILGLYVRDEWRLGVAKGMSDLRSFRFEAGLEELAQALQLAREQGKETSFCRTMAGQDPSGRIMEILAEC